MNSVEINGIMYTGREIMRGYTGRIEVMDHDDCDQLDDLQLHDIRQDVRSMTIHDSDLTDEQAEEGYTGADIVLGMDTTDTGWDIVVDWCASGENRESRELNEADAIHFYAKQRQEARFYAEAE